MESRELMAADLKAHWRADDLKATVSDGQVVSQWVDLVGGITARSTGNATLAANAASGRAMLMMNAADGADAFTTTSNENPIARSSDFGAAIYFRTASTDLAGGVTNWFQNTGLVDATQLGFGRDWGLAINHDGQLAAGASGGIGAPTTTVYSSNTGLNDGQGHSAIMTFQGSQLSLYVDGQLVGSRNDAFAGARSPSGVAIGGLLSRANYFSGDIGEVRLYNGALTPAEVATLTTQLRNYYENQLPVAVADSYALDEDTASFQVSAGDGVLKNDTDSEGDRLSAAIVDQPQHGTVTLNADGSFTYVVATDYTGSDQFSYRVSDHREANVATVTLQIRPVYDPPHTAADRFVSAPDRLLSVAAAGGVLANDFSVDGRSLRAVLVDNTAQGTVTLRGDGSFDYDPRGFRGRTFFTYRVDDGQTQSGPIRVDLIINTAPVTTPDQYEVNEDTQLVVFDVNRSVLVNDRDGEGDRLSAELVDNVTKGTLTLSPNGIFAYKPEANYFGPVTFTYRASDGEATSEPTTVTINVLSVNDVPVAQADGYLVTPDQPLVIDVANGLLRNDSDLEETVLHAALVENVTHGRLTLRDDGSFVYEPEVGYVGVDSFRYTAHDATHASQPVVVQLGISSQPLVISEVLARNVGPTVTRVRSTPEARFSGERASYDWIEVHNQLPIAFDIGGMHLTDNADDLTQWAFPNGTIIGPNGYISVFASSLNITDTRLDEQTKHHTNFSLNSDGEYLALTSIGGDVIDAFAPSFPPQSAGISYGRDAQGNVRYLVTPTFNAENVSSSMIGKLEGPTIVTPHGFYTQAIQVTITNPDPSTTVRFTVNGSEPTLANSEIYTGPITVSSTTVLRARAFKDDYLPSRTDTRSYVFLADVLKQSADGVAPAGWPAKWGSNRTDYGMDPDIVNSPKWGPQLMEALTEIPSMSVVTDLANLFDTRTGIYSRPSGTGFANERPASVELLNPDGTVGFQHNIGLRIRGGFSRDTNNPKHGLRFFFDSPYGDGWLNYPLFEEEGATQFAKVDLRTTQNYSWAFQNDGRNTFLRDIYSRDLQGAMGAPYTRGRFYHLYINGQYWGLYQTDERVDSNSASSYMGGDPEDYDIAHNNPRANEATDGNLDAYRRLWEKLTQPGGLGDANMVDYYRAQGMNPDGTRNPAYERLLDVDNVIDYMIITYFTSDADGPGSKFTRPGLNNYFASYNRDNPDGWKFYEHDSEHSLDTGDAAGANFNMVTPFLTNKTFPNFNPHWMHEQLANSNSDYLTRFRDRVAELFANGGLLSDEVYVSMLERRANEINMAIIAESARWGDSMRPNNPFTKDDWLKAVYGTNGRGGVENWTKTRGRRAEVLRQLAGVKWWYPNTNTPTFDRTSGPVDRGTQVTVSLDGAGDVYVTTDGSDPRATGGGINPNAIRVVNGGKVTIAQGSILRARNLNGVEWSPVAEARFVVDPLATSASLRVTEVNYNPGKPTEAEKAAGFTSNEDFEFVEVTNVGQQTIDLSGTKLRTQRINGDDQGVKFDFAKDEPILLAPGQSMVVVKKFTAFAMRYGYEHLPIAGQWIGGLDNAGETITLAYPDGTQHSFAYSDRWYPDSDGRGASLEIADPAKADLAIWSTSIPWRASFVTGGTPGVTSRLPGDSNRDGLFDNADLLTVFQAGEYDDAILGNSTFEEGDWNGDGEFDSSDIVFVFELGLFKVNAATTAVESIAAALDHHDVDRDASKNLGTTHSRDAAVCRDSSIAANVAQTMLTREASLEHIFAEWSDEDHLAAEFVDRADE